MPLPVQNPRAAGELQRAYDVVGRLRLLLDEVVVPVHVVGELAAADELHPELYEPAGIGWFSGHRNLAAPGAGITGAIALTNPVGSNVLGVVSKIIVVNSASNGAELLTEVPAATVLTFDGQTGAPRDTRYLPSNPGPSGCTIGDLAAAVIPGRFMERLQLAAGTSRTFEGPIVIGPGTRIFVRSTSDNATIRAGFIWTEQALPRSSS